MKLLLYCTKSKPYLYQHFSKEFLTSNTYDKNCIYNGKIVAECDYVVEEIEHNLKDMEFWIKEGSKVLYKKSCLNYNEMYKYLQPHKLYCGYAIHIKNLHIFDEPKELGNYYSQNQVDFIEETELWRLKNGITKAPQNMCYAYKYNWRESKLDKYILISIQPQWLCKILNGEKIIEVRKKVLKGMLKNE